ncbi:hypothetical protein RAMLITH_15900 [Ramlibacter sp. RBP-2]|uniref:Uncharacterized protein n=1 Tax=Ramlibacter lithotrophicus TaxID=2606681 RepID=A0A7X6DHM0_9BURK|nr:hypothetical protein [Ramlibacter lithotrophicus]NKE67309.1 hypothetical protein [Ramlibacter lithotrophicus]
MSATATKPPVSAETLQAARDTVRTLLESSEAYARMPEASRKALAHDLVQVGSFLAEPGMRVPAKHMSPDVLSLAQADSGSTKVGDQPKFGQAVRTGVEQAVALIEGVNFPAFVSGLIEGVFHSIVKSSIEQMEAYGKLVADVSKSLNQFRDDNTTANQGRDHLVEQFPDLFELQMPGDDPFASFGDSSAPASPRVALREGVDERQAVARVNASLPLDKPVTKLDDELVEALLVPAARTQIATGRQQLLATMVMMGINRIVVTDGKIQAKVMFDFQAKDNRRYQASASQFDYAKDAYGNLQKTRGYEGEYESGSKGGSYTRDKDGSVSSDSAGYYSKGTYKYSEKPVITAMSSSRLADDSSLQTKASLLGNVEVNFKSDYLPLEKMATPENIAAIQMNAQPGMVKTMAGRPQRPAAAPAAAAPAAAPATTPAA